MNVASTRVGPISFIKHNVLYAGTKKSNQEDICLTDKCIIHLRLIVTGDLQFVMPTSYSRFVKSSDTTSR